MMGRCGCFHNTLVLTLIILCVRAEADTQPRGAHRGRDPSQAVVMELITQPPQPGEPDETPHVAPVAEAPTLDASSTPETPKDEALHFTNLLFQKYSKNGSKLEYNDFKELLRNIGLGSVTILEEFTLDVEWSDSPEHDHGGHSELGHGRHPGDIAVNLDAHSGTDGPVSDSVTESTRHDQHPGPCKKSTTEPVADKPCPRGDESPVEPTTDHRLIPQLLSAHASHRRLSTAATTVYTIGGQRHVFYESSSEHDEAHTGHDLAHDGNNTNHLDADKHATKQCLSPAQIFEEYMLNKETPLTEYDFLYLCPSLLYQIDEQVCVHHVVGTLVFKEKSMDGQSQEFGANDTLKKWGYGFMSITVISLVSILGLAVVPIMKGDFYRQMLQFMVALAIGTLAGDAVLHLIPHALTMSHSEEGTADHDHTEHHDPQFPPVTHSPEQEAGADTNSNNYHEDHTVLVWRGVMTLVGIFGFFIIERVVEALGEARESSHRDELLDEINEKFIPYKPEYTIGYKLSNHGEGSSDCIYHIIPSDSGLTQKQISNGTGVSNISTSSHTNLMKHVSSSEDQTLSASKKPHGHSHGMSGDVVNKGIATIALMVIIGDGLHNLIDGLAIGAAFSAGISDGLSTSIAVFCHELPHELGDFALLLTTGMSAKQALVYSGVSSFLSYVGMVIGVATGSLGDTALYMFAMAGGLFLYIALVDMLPQLNESLSETPKSRRCFSIFCQACGLTLGLVIMILIATFEEQIRVQVD